MSEKFLPFALPEIGEDEIQEVVASLRSGWVTTGPKVKQFETDFSIFLGGGVEAIAVNSATAGLHLALEAVGVTEGDEVIVPSYTFTATAEVVRYLNATPIFVDVDDKTFNISLEEIEKAITPKTKAIIPVHFAGLSCDIAAIIELAHKNNIYVIEDAAHALPCTSQGKMIGTLDSDVTVFSFYANKTMTTGEGGMIVTRNQQIAERCKIMRLHGISRDAFDRYVSEKPAWYYEVVAPGYKYNMTDISAAIGIHQLKRLKGFQRKREKMAQVYNKELIDLPVKLPANAPEGDLHARHLYPIRLLPDAKVSRDEFINKMAENKIGCSVHFIPLHKQPYWRNTYNLTTEDFPVSEQLFSQEVSIPLYTLMSEGDQEHVIKSIRRILMNG